METREKRHEARLRKQLQKQGLALHKSRRKISADNLGEYMIVDIQRNLVLAGNRYDMSLADIEAYLR